MPIPVFFHNNLTTPETSSVYVWGRSLSWIGLVNWIPLFFSFIAFQAYTKDENDRQIIGKFLIAGTFPVLISGFSQLIFKSYGPFVFLNGFIVWFQREIDPMEGISAVFNNQNYAGTWFCIVWPFCLSAFLYAKNNIHKYISFSFLITVTVSLILTSSRSAWLSLLLLIPFMTEASILVWFLPLILIGAILIVIANANFIPVDFQNQFRNLLPKYMWLKFATQNYTTGLSRIEIWQQALIFISQKPFLGWGASTFPILYYSIKNVTVLHSHNIIFELAISYGLPITMLIFGAIFTITTLSFVKIFSIKNLRKRILNEKAWFTSFFILLLSQLVDIQYYDGRISILFWILLAGLKQIITINKSNHFNFEEPSPIAQ
tara:strand:+ start:3933 stop:5057 length:1125 start_codon:yes stop_codon:yes gene_type:complete